MMEAVLAGVLGTKGAITDLGRISPVSSSGDSVPKSFGKKSPLREACDVLPSGHLQKKVAMIHPCGSAEMIHPCGSADKRQGCFQKETALPRGEEWSCAWRTGSPGGIICWDTWLLLFRSGF